MDNVVETPVAVPVATFDDFLKIDMRAGTVLSVEAVAKSKKLLKLQVSFGPVIGNRTIMAGIAQAAWYGQVVDGAWEDKALVGARIIAVVNLAPRAMMGVESHGMVLAAHTEDGNLYLVGAGPLPDGAQIG